MKGFTAVFIAALIACVQAIPNTVTIPKVLVFSTRTPIIDDAVSSSTDITIRLATAPVTEALVYLESPGLQFTTCLLRFTALNFATPQRVTMVAGGFGRETSYNVKTKVFAVKSAFHLQEDGITVGRRCATAGVCLSVGDPHYQTLDGLKYTEQALGAVYLVKTQTLIVQALQATCHTGVTCNHGVSIQYGTSVIQLLPDANSRTTMTATPLTTPLSGITTTNNIARNQYQFAIADGSSIAVNMFPWVNSFYMDVVITLAGTHRQRTSGICGNFNGVSTDDRVAPASYLVPANENIFTTRRAVAIQGTTIRTTTSCLIPTIANTNGCESEFMPTGWGTATPPRVQRRSPMPRRDKPSSPITTAKAKKMCGTIRRLVSACRLAEQPVDVERFVTSCSADLVATQDKNVVRASRKSYLATCGELAMNELRFRKGKLNRKELRTRVGKVFKESEKAATLPVDEV